MSHDFVYVLDQNLVTAYKRKSIPGWNEYADEHAKLGKKMYMVSIPAKRRKIPCLRSLKCFNRINASQAKDWKHST